MISRYLRRQPTVRRDLSAAGTFTGEVLFKMLLWAVSIGSPLYFGAHVLVAIQKNLL